MLIGPLITNLQRDRVGWDYLRGLGLRRRHHQSAQGEDDYDRAFHLMLLVHTAISRSACRFAK